MAVLKILTKKGVEMEIPVMESVEQVDRLIVMREMGRHTKVKLTEPDGKPRLLAIGYLYDIIENGSVNTELDDNGNET